MQQRTAPKGAVLVSKERGGGQRVLSRHATRNDAYVVAAKHPLQTPRDLTRSIWICVSRQNRTVFCPKTYIQTGWVAVHARWASA